MKRAGLVISTAALAACSLLTSLDGLSDGDAGGADAATIDAPADATTIADSTVIEAGEAGPVPGAAYRAAVVADSPISYWRFEETSGTVAKDEMGAHDGTYVDGPTLGAAGIAPGTRAITISATAKSHVFVGSSAFRFPGDASFTIELWAKGRVFTDYQWIGGTEIPDSPRAGWSLLGHSDRTVAYEAWAPPTVDGGINYARSVRTNAKPLEVDRFQHVVFTYDGATLLSYVDGDLANTGVASRSTPDVGELRWGCRSLAAGLACLDGWSLDEIAVYGKALTAARIKAHFDASKQ